MSISVSVILTADLDETSNRTVKNPKVLNDLIEGIFAVRRTALIAFASKSNCRSALRGTVVRHLLQAKEALVGRGGLEPPTSRLSGVRSNHLSYRPS